MQKKKSTNLDNVPETAITLEDKLTPEQKKTWKNIKQGFIELKMAEEGKIKFRPIQELIGEL